MARYHDALVREFRAIRAERRVGRRLGAEDRCTGGPADPVVSLTSYPPRIAKVHWTLRSLLVQTQRPGRVELVLSEDEFPGRELPSTISQLAQRGVHVLWVPGNIRSFKKLLPVLETSGDRVIVTADDDIIYPSDWLAGLWAAHQGAPETIWGTRGREILVRGAEVRPYSEWSFATRATPSERLLLTGMGGILYPPGSLSGRIHDMDAAMRLCPNADDIWFKACALLAGTEVRQVADQVSDHPTRLRAQLNSLQARNLHEGENDRQFRRTFDELGLLPALLRG